LQTMFITNEILQHLVKTIENFNKTEEEENYYSDEFQYFTFRTLFIITVLCKGNAPCKIRNVLNGVPPIITYLELKISQLHLDQENIGTITSKNDSKDLLITSDII